MHEFNLLDCHNPTFDNYQPYANLISIWDKKRNKHLDIPITKNNNCIGSSSYETAWVFMSTPIAVSILRSVDKAKVAKVLKESEIYNLKIKLKKSEISLLKVLLTEPASIISS